VAAVRAGLPAEGRTADAVPARLRAAGVMRAVFSIYLSLIAVGLLLYLVIGLMGN
jgi:hypothetical protein